ncbi:ribose-phosphate diphosphokinase [Ehrlichia ruminantium]|uniref:ribose-phosphate diphosphokinase n=1 Tax=Ehrlichia ruminantium TaxID=779 RepID=A0AAE6QB92_EHRRU|nr:ribose-phosphate diphosphokinase [Ehrlichia ruminantium]QGR02858.1 ribose-phosphate diphosphokinase [Ehrlichia ruminantium]QGR03783.1 ribose-phosphate diphosphokinase [Ehrlichia ruminantium]QGR04710.1 ribose-phosphate diphosphokinase [Ehrlichia ruminantium]
MLISAGIHNTDLAKRISELTHIRLIQSHTSRFADQELNVEVEEIQGNKNKHIILLHSITSPAHDSLLELLLLIDALKRALSPNKITLIIPYCCYTRQDRIMYRISGNSNMVSALSAKVIANVLQTTNANNITFIDLHSNQLIGFFDTDITNLSANSIFIDAIIQKCTTDNLVIVSPDYGALNRTRAFAHTLAQQYNLNNEIQIAIIDKHRTKPGVSEVMNIIGNVANKECIIVDDIVDSGGTLCNAALALKNNGALQVSAYITHGVLSGNALDKIANSQLTTLTITDTINHCFINTQKVKVLSIDKFISNYILYTLSN